MKKILIALDYDPSAEKIADTGNLIAAAFDAEIILLHVVAEPSYYSSMEYSPIMGYSGFMDNFNMEISEEVKNNLTALSEEFLEKFKKHLGNDRIKTLVAEGNFAETITATAEKEMADMIVMGSHGRRGLDKLLMENVAEKVLQLSKVPVLVIPIQTP
jgi:nucleotide-binding universal stress UspA family protein